MKKKFFSKVFLFTVIATLVTFTACKDYDDDIDMLDGKIDNLANSTTTGQTSLKAELQQLIATTQASADKANAGAAAAQKTANDALKAGGDAQAAANAAQKTADDAQSAADKAQADADKAKVAADAAADAADAAQKTADDAKTATEANAADIIANADIAAQAADKAQKTADDAKAVADAAKTAAENAQGTADANALEIAANKAAAAAAQTAAENAQEAADKAQAAADKAQAAADAAQDSANTNAENIELNKIAAQAAADAAQAAHDAADLAQNAADNALEVAEGAADAAQGAADAAQGAADAAAAAQKAADEAKAKGLENADKIQENADAINTAQAAADAAQVSADAAQVSADAAQEKADALQVELNELKADVEALELKIDALDAENKAAHEVLAEEISVMKVEIAAMKLRVMELFAKRITSVTLVPTSHINGIAAITFKSIQFTPQTLIDLKDQGEYGYAVEATQEAKALVLDGQNTYAEFRLSPRYVTSKSIGFPYFESIVSENITRAVSSDNTGKNKPIAPVADQELNVSPEGVLKLQIAKTVETLVASDKNGNTEKFYFASLAIPVADEYLTEDEKENGGAVVTSEHYRIDELITTPRIKSKKAGDIVKAWDPGTGLELGQVAEEELHYYPYALDADDNPVHFSSAAMLYVEEPNHKVDENVVYNVAKDLNELVLVGSEEDHSTIENFADYGISFKFEVATDVYLLDSINQQLFASIDENGVLTSKKATVAGVEYSPVGKQPIIKVTLLKEDGANDPLIMDVRYIKVKFVSAPVPPVTHTFDARLADCEQYMQFFISEEMMEEYFYTPTELSKDEFLSKYVLNNDNRKEGDIGGIKIAGYPEGPIRWTLTLDQVKENLGKPITITFKLVNEDDDTEIEVTLNSAILQPTVKITGLVNNYWDANNEYVRFNSREPKVGDTNPDNNTFRTKINNIFDTDDAEDVLSLTGYNYSYYFVEDQPLANVTLDDGTEVEIIVRTGGKVLDARTIENGVETDRPIATINDRHELTYLKSNAIAKALLNKGKEFMKARLGIKVTLDCGIEVAVTGLGTETEDGEFNVHFLRPVNIEPESAKPFIDAVDFGATGSVLGLKDLVKLSDWRNYAKDTDKYYFDPSNPTYYDYYDVTAIDVDIANITTEGLLIDGQPTTKLPKTISVRMIEDTDLDLTKPEYQFTYGALTYRNNGANLIDSFKLKVPVTVTYTWGKVTTIVDVEVKKTAATRSIM